MSPFSTIHPPAFVNSSTLAALSASALRFAGEAWITAMPGFVIAANTSEAGSYLSPIASSVLPSIGDPAATAVTGRNSCLYPAA